MSNGSKAEFRRLPSAVTPRHYVITIRPQLKSFTFAGSEEISVGVSEQTKQIVLNSLDIDITSATFTTSDAKTLTSVRIESSAETETTCIDFAETLPLGSGELKLEFTGFINDKLKGFYRSKYTAADGQQDRYAAVTQFAPTDARRAFPCWDEPALKATFDIRLVVPKHLKALSNMDSSAVIPLADSDLKEVQFPTTPLMSTYLIAYAVGEFDLVEGKTVNGHTVRVYTPVGKKDQGVFALDVAIKSLTYYEDYFDIPYPLFKLDISKYTAADGQQDRYSAVTHFEATEARRAFPCWDEPALKATFDIRLVVPPGVKALSNMDALRVKDFVDSDLIEIEFMTTPLMSTYLIAYAVGEFDFVEGKTVNGHTVRVYTPVGKKDQGVFALDVAIKSLTYYEDYFDIPYPLSKLDMLFACIHRWERKIRESSLWMWPSNPVSDFPIGAMENWGLITYRETCILVDPQNTSTFSKQRTAIIIAHEIAHQWFGNLVTMDWWTDLWLKEGFATFISYLCVNHLFSEYHIWTQFVSDEYLTALNLDALHNSHPIEVPVGHPSEIIEIFDRISYDKGSAVLRMLHRYIGDEYFRKGLHLYLDQHKYGNTVTDDLWTSLQKASDRPVREVMNTWTKQKGYPVITVKSRRDGNSLILSLSQEKFNADGKADSEVSPLWMIPI
ncbi:unnamed protein product, partial [Medioppia subpectinata]